MSVLICSCLYLEQIVITLGIYGVKKIVGIPFGYHGFIDKELTEMPVSASLNLLLLGFLRACLKFIICFSKMTDPLGYL